MPMDFLLQIQLLKITSEMLSFLRYLKSYHINKKKEQIINKDLVSIYVEFSSYTMIPEKAFLDNLLLCDNVKEIEGDVVECGVWRGGMIAGIAKKLGMSRNYYLFDSFEGLPEATEIDGQTAMDWQKNTNADNYFNNCSAEIDFAIEVMKKVKVKYECIKGWFSETIPTFDGTDKIAILRLDGDWYDSTLICLKYLFPKVVKGGIIIIDDYYTWDGCSKAVHDYLSEIKSASRIFSSKQGVCYIIKIE